MLFESDDAATLHYLASLVESRIRPLEIPVSPKLPFGTLCNLSIDAARARYIAQWDDDDWPAPARLAEQVAVIRQSHSAKVRELLHGVQFPQPVPGSTA